MLSTRLSRSQITLTRLTMFTTLTTLMMMLMILTTTTMLNKLTVLKIMTVLKISNQTILIIFVFFFKPIFFLVGFLPPDPSQPVRMDKSNHFFIFFFKPSLIFTLLASWCNNVGFWSSNYALFAALQNVSSIQYYQIYLNYSNQMQINLEKSKGSIC